ncbi:MAG: biosynthetic arginine decarboxylase [Planctomycetota bacterium]
MESWTVQDSAELYQIRAWGAGFFEVSEAGNVVVRPGRRTEAGIDLKQLVDDLRRRGYGLPLLLRFRDILDARARELGDCFGRAMREYGYEGAYRSVYPIKVNQQRHVVEELLHFGREFHLGLEVGSKPEALVALALLDDPAALIVCNGYKDEDYIETVLLAQKLGRTPILVLDRFRELEPVLRLSRQHGVRPNLGLRARLQARGAGKWAESGGDRSKFGLSSAEIVDLVAALEQDGMLDCLQLLHFHLGSQITDVRRIKNALREAARIFVELHGLGAGLRYFDVGGGLGVDYDGSNTNFHSSMNYTVGEYANNVVEEILDACQDAGVPHPTVVTECGRALVAHHSVLVVDVLDTTRTVVSEHPEPPAAEDHEVVRDFYETWQWINRKNLLESFHDAIQLRDEAIQLFDLGYLDLRARARAERLFYACCSRIRRLLKDLPRVPEELEGLQKGLSDTYYCNFSVFQSLPDSWAVDQLFPVMPIHRLDERPTRQAILVDLTCDSDGRVDSFIDPHDVKEALELHEPDGASYTLGVFLVGAYQEILGDLHNLFGDTTAIHVSLNGGRYRVEHVVEGDTVTEVLSYVEFDRGELLRRVRGACEEALLEGRLSPEESALLLRRYESGLSSYTYLSPSRLPAVPEAEAPRRVRRPRRRAPEPAREPTAPRLPPDPPA